MNRRDFLKTSALATSAALVCLPGEFTDKLPDEYVNPHEWFMENKVWLKKWFLKSDRRHHKRWSVDGHPMQIFRDEYEVMETPKSSGLFTARYMDSELMNMHIDNILLACVFGMETRFSGTTIEGSACPRTMSGFVEQTGRYPTKKDRILIQYLRLFNQFAYIKYNIHPTTVVISELRIKVL